MKKGANTKKTAMMRPRRMFLAMVLGQGVGCWLPAAANVASNNALQTNHPKTGISLQVDATKAVIHRKAEVKRVLERRLLGKGKREPQNDSSADWTGGHSVLFLRGCFG